MSTSLHTSDVLPIRHALLSVYDKAAVVPLARTLQAQQVTLYASAGTCAYLEKEGIATQDIQALTGEARLLGGRVKTLHPSLFAGILYRQHETADQQTMQAHQWVGFELVVVDLYPFEETVAQNSGDLSKDHAAGIEHIDIGGVALLRAAAKNHDQVWVMTGAYAEAIQHLETHGATSTKALRKQAAIRAFAQSSNYDAQIHQWLSQETKITSDQCADDPLVLGKKQALRYGENPHQAGFFYGDLEAILDQKQGKALSYNNLLDIDTGLNLAAGLGTGAFVIIKHRNPCGVAIDSGCVRAYERAWAGDSLAAFGGIFIYNGTLTAAVAKSMVPHFFEVVAARDYEAEALEIFATKPTRRMLVVKQFVPDAMEYRSALGGILAQQADELVQNPNQWECVTRRTADATTLADLGFALQIAKWSCSNAIVLAKDQQALGISSGQTARIDALHMAIEKAKRGSLSLAGGVMASEAFFPFEDSVAMAHEAGIEAVVQPGGSIQDQRSIDYCDAHNMCMVFCKTRHFRH